MTNQDYKITRGRIEVEVPHQGDKLTFVWPIKGPETYANVKEQIESNGLVAPTMAQTVSLVYTANQNSNEPEFNEVISRLDNNCLWGFNGVLYLPRGEGDYQNGAIIQDNPQIKDGRVFLDKSELIKKLGVPEDKSVRFVPFGYKLSVQTASELAKNPFVIGLAGEEGAEKLAKVSEKYINNPRVWSFDNVEEEIAGVSGLYSNWDDDRLDVDGNYNGDLSSGYAFGVLASTKDVKPA